MPQMMAVAMSQDAESARNTARYAIAMYMGQQPHIAKASGVDEAVIQNIHDTMGGWPPREGGIEIKKLGVRIYFPRGALSERTRITVKPLEGSVVGFTFKPHGLIFDVPVEVRIDQNSPLLADFDVGNDGSAYTLPDLVGVYFLGDPANSVIPLEILPIYVDGGDLVLEITHFSGYALAGYVVASG